MIQPPPITAEPIIEPPVLPARKFSPILILAVVILLVLVGAGGIFLGKSLNPPSESASPAIVPISATTPDITANWRTYINNDYGNFELKYPDNYFLSEGYIKPKIGEFTRVHTLSLVKEVNRKTGQPPSITLDIVTSKKTVREYIDYDRSNELAEFQSWKQVSGLNSAEPKIISTSQVQGNGIVATKIERQRMDTAPNSKQNQYIFENNGFVYVLSVNYGTYNPDTKEDGSDERNTLDIIFSTFKFSNSSQADETANWKTYTNNDYKFSFRYPLDITISKEGYDLDTSSWHLTSPVYQAVLTKKGQNYFIIEVSKNYSSGDPSYVGPMSIGQKTIGNISWEEYFVPNDYGEGPPIPPIYALKKENNSVLYGIRFSGQKDTTEEQNQILSTFKFTSP